MSQNKKHMKFPVMNIFHCDHQYANNNLFIILSNWTHGINQNVGKDIVEIILKYNHCRVIPINLIFKTVEPKCGGRQPPPHLRKSPKETITGTSKSHIAECQSLSHIAKIYNQPKTKENTKMKHVSVYTKFKPLFSNTNQTSNYHLDRTIPLNQHSNIDQIDCIEVLVSKTSILIGIP
eukprot:225469_1